MSVEVNVSGMACGAKRGGLSCVYCYESPLEAAEAALPVVDHGRIQRTVEALDPGRYGFSLFGGEPLLARLEDLEKLWAFGLKRFGKNGVQTSGRPITDEHFALFHKYRVSVGFSIDGPEELNDSRWAGSTAETRKATAHSLAMMRRALEEGLGVGCIITLHRKNVGPGPLPRFLDWLEELDAMGLTSGVLHLLEKDGPTRWLALTPEENLEALLAIHRRARRLKGLRFDLFDDVVNLLRGRDSWVDKDGVPGGVGCTWSACDPLATQAVKGVNPDGSRSMCPRVHKGTTEWSPAPSGPLARQLVLRDTPQADGGCQGCRQLITCKGQCPGTALEGDWRKRSADCATWKGLLEHFEDVLLELGETPVTLRADRDRLEERMAAEWAEGRPVRLAELLKSNGRPSSTSSSGARRVHEDYADHDDHDDLSRALALLEGGRKVKS